MTIEDDAEFDEIDRLLAAPRRERDREELARRRSARRRTLDMLECVPATHDVDRCIVIAVRRFLEARGVKKPGDLIDVDTSAARDPSAAALVDRIVEAIKESRFDIRNRRTRNRVWVRLGLAQPMQPRPRSDEFPR